MSMDVTVLVYHKHSNLTKSNFRATVEASFWVLNSLCELAGALQNRQQSTDSRLELLIIWLCSGGL